MKSILLQSVLSGLLGVSALAMQTGCANPCTLPIATVSIVTVVDNATGTPINGANVTFQSNGSTQTLTMNGGTDGGAGAGEYLLTGSVSNSGTLHVEAPGYQVFDRTLTASDFAMPTGCGFAIRFTARLNRI